ncbi:MAG: helix-turn-helix domain-containing protein [Sedimentitalea sp.]|nr:helix-turn-helix domain-containing protein [Sedimentitalea sp.]
MTQDDLSQVVGVGRKFISSVENGKDTAQIGLILDLCRELGLELTLTTGGGCGQGYGDSQARPQDRSAGA